MRRHFDQAGGYGGLGVGGRSVCCLFGGWVPLETLLSTYEGALGYYSLMLVVEGVAKLLLLVLPALCDLGLELLQHAIVRYELSEEPPSPAERTSSAKSSSSPASCAAARRSA